MHETHIPDSGFPLPIWRHSLHFLQVFQRILFGLISCFHISFKDTGKFPVITKIKLNLCIFFITELG